MSTSPGAALPPPLQPPLPPRSSLRALFESLRRDTFLLILIAALVPLAVITPNRLASFPALVDWATIGALTGLLALTKGLELSGAIAWLGLRLAAAMATERALAL